MAETDTAGSGTQRIWLAIYTRARHETAVARQLKEKQVAFLLPMYPRFSRWSDRIQRVETPLLPGYVFVNVSDEERLRVLQTAGVVHIVASAGQPARLKDSEVEWLRRCAEQPDEVEPHPFLRVGQRVRVKHGAFAGCEGILQRKKNAARLVVSLGCIQQSVSVDLHGADVESVA